MASDILEDLIQTFDKDNHEIQPISNKSRIDVTVPQPNGETDEFYFDFDHFPDINYVISTLNHHWDNQNFAYFNGKHEIKASDEIFQAKDISIIILPRRSLYNHYKEKVSIQLARLEVSIYGNISYHFF